MKEPVPVSCDKPVTLTPAYFDIGGDLILSEEVALAQLLLDDAVFCNSRDYSFNGKPAGHTVVMFVLCNDIFAWACADGEDLPSDKIQELYEMHIANRKWGTAKWCCKRRNEQPQRPVAEAMKKDGAWEDWMDTLNPNHYDKACKEHHERTPKTRKATEDTAH